MRKFSVHGFVLLSIENVIVFLPVWMPLRKSLTPSCHTSNAFPQSVYWGVSILRSWKARSKDAAQWQMASESTFCP